MNWLRDASNLLGADYADEILFSWMIIYRGDDVVDIICITHFRLWVLESFLFPAHFLCSTIRIVPSSL